MADNNQWLDTSQAITAGAVGAGLSFAQMNESYRKQKKLMRLQAELNETAAANAADRQKEFYDYTYGLNTLSAKRKQMEDAGLSVGLMYGGGGAAGTGGGATGGNAPQGGVSPQTAPAMADVAGNALAISGIKRQAAETQLVKAEARKAEAEAKSIESSSDYKTENERYEAIIKMNTALEQTFEMWDRKGIDYLNMRWVNDVLNHEIKVGDESTTVRQTFENLNNTISNKLLTDAQTGNERAKKKLLKLEAELMAFKNRVNEKTEDEQVDIIKDTAQALAVELGKDWTWRSVLHDGIQVIDAASNLTRTGALVKGAKNMGKPKTTEKYDEWGQLKEFTYESK